MKKVIILSAVVVAFGLMSFMAAVNLKIKGSDTLLPLAQKWSEDFMKANAGSKVTVTGGGSGVGIAALLDGSTDLASASRPIKMDEKMKFTDSKRPVKEVTVAWDALAVVVNSKNPVKKFTREQLEDIFTGKITNWKQVGGTDSKIICYSRESSSGTYEFFKEHVLDKKNYASSCLLMPATGAIIQSVSQTPGAIGYVGLAYLTSKVTAASISYDQGKNFVKPSLANAKNKTYPVARKLFFYYLASKEAQYKPFMDFVLSKKGQKIVEEVGYVPL